MPATAQPAASSGYVDFDEYVDFQLEKTRNSIKWTDIATAAAVVGAFIVGYLLVFAVLDHWIVPGGFGRTARFVMAGLLAALSGGWLSWKVLLPYLKQVSGLYAARTIELSEPGLKSTLLNLVDLRRAGREVPEEIRGALEKRAAQALAKMDVDQAVDRRPLMRSAYVLLGLVVLICLYSVFSPKKISFARALLPPANVGPSTRTTILDVRTNPPLTRTAEREVDVVARSQLEVVVDLSGEVPEEVTLKYTTADRKFVDEPVTMQPVEEGLKQYRGLLNGENGRGILQNLSFRVEAGDDVSDEYKVLVNQAPSAAIESVRYAYPEYMELENRTQPGGNIDAWEGTTVTVSATVNQPVKTAVLQFFDDETAGTRAEEIGMEIVGGTRLKAAWPLKIRTDGTFARSYRIYCVGDDGQADPEPALYTHTIRPDRRPVVELLDPRSDLEVPTNAIIPLLIEAHDPDFKLTEITLQRKKNGEELFDKPQIFKGLEKEFRGTWNWHLKPMQLVEGDVVTFWLEARDNRQPSGNVSEKRQMFELHIVEKVSEEEADRQLKVDEERIEQKLKEDRGEDNQEGRPDQPQQDEGQQGDDGQPQEKQGDESKPGEAQPEEGDAGNEGEKPGDRGSKPGDNGNQPGDENKPGDRQQPKAGEEGAQDPADGVQKEGNPEKPGQEKQRPLDKQGNDDSEALRRLLEQHQKQQQKNKQEGGQPKDGERQPGEKQGDRPNDDGGKPPGAKHDPGKPENKEPGKGDQPPMKNPNGAGNDGGDPQPGNEPDGEQPSDGEKGTDKDKPAQPKGDKGAQPEGAGDKGGEAGDKAGSDKGDSQGKPSAGEDSDTKNQPGGEGDKRKQGEKNANPTDKPLDGDEQSADDDPAAQKKKATGDEEGPATGNDYPDADPTQAQKKLERKPGEKGPTRPSKEQPDDKTERRQGDGTGSKNPDRANPAPMTKKGDENKGREGENPDKTPSTPRESNPQMPAARQDEIADKGNEETTGKGRPEGMSSEKPQGGDEGSGKPNDQGQDGGNKPGAGNSTDKPGTEEKSDGSKPGEQGDERGEGSQKTDGESKPGGGKAGSDAGKPGESAGEGKPGEPASGDAKSDQPGGASQPGSEPKGGGSARGGNRQGPAGAGGGDDGGLAEAEKANMEYNKKAADLVLQQLQDDLDNGKTDQKLLDEFGWTKKDLERYLERMRKNLDQPPGDASPQSEAGRRQVEEFLKGYNLRKGTSERDRQDGGVAPQSRPVPAEIREAYDAYTRSLRKKAAQRDRQK